TEGPDYPLFDALCLRTNKGFVMPRLTCTSIDRPFSRRHFLAQLGAGFGQLALAALLAEEQAKAAVNAPANPLAVRPPHFAPRARRVIMLFMFGGPSHLDTFDPKPDLVRDHGRPLPPEMRPRVISFPQRMGGLMASPFAFRQQGQSGIWVSELFPHVAR